MQDARLCDVKLKWSRYLLKIDHFDRVDVQLQQFRFCCQAVIPPQRETVVGLLEKLLKG